MRLTADMAQRVLAELETAEAARAVNALCREHVGDALVRLAELAGSAAKPQIRAAAAERLGRELQRLPPITREDAPRHAGGSRDVAAIVVGMSRVHGP